MKPIDVKDNTYINIGKGVNDKDPEFKLGDHLTISKYKNIFLKAILQIGMKKFYWLNKFHGLTLLMI